MHRFFVDPSVVSGDQFLITDNELVHQLTRVLRMQSGDEITLLDNDNEFFGRIDAIGKGLVRGTIIQKSRKEEAARCRVILYQSILKKDNFEFVLQKCTELGVYAFQPMLTSRTIKQKNEIPTRWRVIVREAAEQSGRIRMPEIYKPISFNEAVRKCSEDITGSGIIAHEKERKNFLPQILKQLPKTSTIHVFIGPEGGFSDEEIEIATRKNIAPAFLSTLTLRAETAAIVASALILSLR